MTRIVIQVDPEIQAEPLLVGTRVPVKTLFRLLGVEELAPPCLL